MRFKLEKMPAWVRFPVEVGQDFGRHQCAQLAAAIAFYTLFALGPVILIAVSVAGLIVGQDEVRAEIIQGLEGTLSLEATRQVEVVIRNATLPGGGVIATAVGSVTLLIAATAAFNQIKLSLDSVFEVGQPDGRPVWTVLKARLLAFTMVLGIGAVLLGSMIATAAITAVGTWASERLPMPENWLQLTNMAVSFFAMTAMFALIFKALPDRRIEWRDVWFGAAITSILFGVGRHGIGLYLGRSTAASVYGAAGSLVALLFWVYYSAMIFLLGAEITHVRMKWTRRRRRLAAEAHEGAVAAQADQSVRETAPTA